MKRYLATYGFRATIDATGAGRVYVEENGKQRPLKHIVLHSPDGFSWGYAGSGPSDLARCIFLDLFGADRVKMNDANPSQLDPTDGHGEGVVTYQDFKFSVIATLPQSQGWSLTEEEIREECIRILVKRGVSEFFREEYGIER